MAVTQKQVEIAVVVVIEKFQSPSAHQTRGRADAGRKGRVAESLVLVIVVERIHLVIHISLEQIDPSILIIVSGIDSHAGARFAKGIHSNTRQHSDFFKSSFAAIGKQEVWNGIVGDVEIDRKSVV